jgi:hypothetical protein
MVVVSSFFLIYVDGYTGYGIVRCKIMKIAFGSNKKRLVLNFHCFYWYKNVTYSEID